MKNLNVSVVDEILKIGDESIDFPFPLAEAMVMGEKIIIRAGSRTKPINNDRNVYALDYDGKVLWRIELCPYGGERSKPYTIIYSLGSETLVAGNWIGYDFYVDLKDGHITLKAFTK